MANIDEYNEQEFNALDNASLPGGAKNVNSMEIQNLVTKQTNGSAIYADLLQRTNLDIDNSASDLARFIRANGIYQRNDFDDFNTFYLFPRMDPYKMLGTTREYVFFTKPDLHIFRTTEDAANKDGSILNPEIANDPFFRMMVSRGYAYSVLANLQYTAPGFDNRNPFIPILSNYKQSNLELNSVTADDIESAVNMYGTKIAYRQSSYRSDEYTDFSLDFRDDRYLNCYLWFKAYDHYQKRKAEGRVSPAHQEYSIHKIISDQMTLFKFIVGEDGETIIHWSYILGCYPKSVPRETFSDMPADGQLHFSTTWHGSFQDDMNPKILDHFNWLCNVRMYGKQPDELPIYDETIQNVTGEAAFCPYVTQYKPTNSDIVQYKLKWYQVPNKSYDYQKR